MAGVAYHAPRCRKPAAQFALAYPYEDHVSDETRQRVVRRFAQLTTLHERQYVTPAHRDTLHLHEHFIANLVHPETYGVLDYGRLYADLPRLARQLEREFSLAPGGDFIYARDADERAARLEAAYTSRKPKMTRWARLSIGPDIENLFESLVYTWEDLHGFLGNRFGAIYEPTMRGGVIRDAFDGRYRVKASRVHPLLARARLEARLGPYNPAHAALAFSLENSYSHFLASLTLEPPPPELLRRFASAAAERSLASGGHRTRDEWRSDNADRQDQRDVFLSSWLTDLRRLDSIADPRVRTLARNALHVQTLAQYHELELRLLRDGAASRRIAVPRLRWSSWLLDQVRLGDEAALAYVHQIAPGAMRVRMHTLDRRFRATVAQPTEHVR